jgi:hypothetical protein
VCEGSLRESLFEDYFFAHNVRTVAGVSYNHIGPDGARALAEALQINTTLTILSLWCELLVCNRMGRARGVGIPWHSLVKDSFPAHGMLLRDGCLSGATIFVLTGQVRLQKPCGPTPP